ncbi:uncharacterized protein [Hemitrygon akajei]|uniref:uncharacterized protein n=1 Tax=Hemitrygon akajei TaxID=2704970 RepID=UPI003BF9D611
MPAVFKVAFLSLLQTSQVLEVVSSPSQAAGGGEENVGHSSELSPGRANVEQERASEQNADSSEHCSLLQNRAPAEQEEPDQRQRQTEVPSEITAEVQDGTAGSEAENQPGATVQELEAELEAHSGARAVEEESPSHQTSSETSSQILSGSLDKVNQDLKFQPETCHQPQAKAGVQARAEAQDQSLREAQDQGRLPAQGLLQKEFQDQPLQELHDQPEMEEGACDQVHKEVCECGQAEAQHQDECGLVSGCIAQHLRKREFTVWSGLQQFPKTDAVTVHVGNDLQENRFSRKRRNAPTVH